MRCMSDQRYDPKASSKNASKRDDAPAYYPKPDTHPYAQIMKKMSSLSEDDGT